MSCAKTKSDRLNASCIYIHYSNALKMCLRLFIALPFYLNEWSGMVSCMFIHHYVQCTHKHTHARCALMKKSRHVACIFWLYLNIKIKKRRGKELVNGAARMTNNWSFSNIMNQTKTKVSQSIFFKNDKKKRTTTTIECTIMSFASPIAFNKLWSGKIKVCVNVLFLSIWFATLYSTFSLYCPSIPGVCNLLLYTNTHT